MQASETKELGDALAFGSALLFACVFGKPSLPFPSHSLNNIMSSNRQLYIIIISTLFCRNTVGCFPQASPCRSFTRRFLRSSGSVYSSLPARQGLICMQRCFMWNRNAILGIKDSLVVSFGVWWQEFCLFLAEADEFGGKNSL